ncbi:MAG TPA: Bax inhibitor-1 family protein, partial [Chthoniobacterales bacterium]|nr:Bax inhibitor-1 family protein [Chthoniobacterales bacterium]
EERSQFLRRTYMHLAGALVALVGLEAILLTPSIAIPATQLMLGAQYSWLAVLALFMGASWLAQKWAMSGTSMTVQYAGLGLYVVAEAIVLLPILTIAMHQLKEPNLIAMAGMITAGLFLGLTAIVVTTKKDFTFLGGILKVGGFVALGFIVASIVFGFSLGTLFAAVMVAFVGAVILYQTSAIFYQYSTNQYVAASLGLFASVATMFIYVLSLLMGRRN